MLVKFLSSKLQAEDMDRDGAGTAHGGAAEEMEGGGPGWATGTIRRVDPEKWLIMTTKQRKHWRKRGGRGLLGP